MLPNQQQQAYDRAITIFNPDGRLYQVEYAREAVKRGSASVGVAADDGVALVAHKRLGSPLMEAEDVEKLFRIDDHVGAASAGHVTDARTLVDVIRREAQRERAVYDELASVDTLVGRISDEIQEHTQSGGVRPFGVALIVAGVTDGETSVFETDPSGSFTEWRATAIGAKSADIRETLEDAYEEGLTVEDGVALAAEAIREHVEDDVTVADLDAAVVAGEEPAYRELSADELEDHV